MAINPSFVGSGVGVTPWTDVTNNPRLFMVYSNDFDDWQRGIIEIKKSDIARASSGVLVLGASISFTGQRFASDMNWTGKGKVGVWKSDVNRDTHPYPDTSQFNRVNEFGEVTPIINSTSQGDISQTINEFMNSNDDILRLIVDFINKPEIPQGEGITLNIEVNVLGVESPTFTNPTANSVIGKGTEDRIADITWTPANPIGNVSVSRIRHTLSLSKGGGYSRLVDSPESIAGTSYIHDFGLEGEDRWANSRLRINTTVQHEGATYTVPHSLSEVFELNNRMTPEKPTKLSPNNYGNRDAESPIELSWQFNDENIGDYQTKAEIRYKITQNTKWRETTVDTAESVTLPANSLPLGDYEWQVKTRDSTGLWSEWSDIAYFTASDIGNAPEILDPDEFTGDERPFIRWIDVDQSHFQVKVEKDNSVIWDSGEIQSSNNEVRIGTDLDDATEYVISLRVKRDGGLWTEWSTKTITTDFSVADHPNLELYKLDYGIRLVVTGEAHQYNLYKLIDNDWTKIAVINPAESDMYEDLLVASGQEYLYRASSQTAGGNETFSDVVSGKINFIGAYIHTINEPDTLHLFEYGGNERAIDRGIEHAFRQFVGRKKPTIVYGTHQHKSITTNLQIKLDSGDDKALERYLYNRTEVCYRDGRGKLIAGSLTEFPLDYLFWGWNSQITITETDFKEGIE